MDKSTISISPNLDAALQGLKPDIMMRSIARGMTRATQLVSSQIIQQRLTGKGPFPVAASRLGVRSGRLRQSVRGTVAKINGVQVTTTIGSRVSYAAAHEFGFSGKVPVKAHQRTVKVAFGKKLAAPKTSPVKAHQRMVIVPERAPFRTGITERLSVFESQITLEVMLGMQSQTTPA